MLELRTGSEQRFPLIQVEGRDTDQAHHSRPVDSRLRDDEATIGVADQQCRSLQLRQNLARCGYVVSQEGETVLLRDHEMALGLERRDNFAPAGPIGPEPVD